MCKSSVFSCKGQERQYCVLRNHENNTNINVIGECLPTAIMSDRIAMPEDTSNVVEEKLLETRYICLTPFTKCTVDNSTQVDFTTPYLDDKVDVIAVQDTVSFIPPSKYHEEKEVKEEEKDQKVKKDNNCKLSRVNFDEADVITEVETPHVDVCRKAEDRDENMEKKHKDPPREDVPCLTECLYFVCTCCECTIM